MEKELGRSPSGRAAAAHAVEPKVSSKAGIPNANMFKIAPLKMPTEEECRATALKEYEVRGAFDIDRWPDDVAALSMPTKFIEVQDVKEFEQIFEPNEKGLAVAQKYADLIDEEIGWDQHFIRLNSRSPKDSAYPGLPITHSGKQAMGWIMSSMRCMDDLYAPRYAETPLFICLRKRMPIVPAYEFRCFAKDGALVGVTRYDYHNENQMPDADTYIIWKAAKSFYKTHLAYDTVVFDLFDIEKETPLLIELNPYGLSDPCCFKSYGNISGVAMEVIDG